jgi:hypothetical protein
MINGDLGGTYGDLDYTSNEAATLSVKLVSDWWDENQA